MESNARFDPESTHLWEGLEHLVDMLALADPRRPGHEAPGRLHFQSREEWRQFCSRVLRQVEATRQHVTSPEEAAIVEAAVRRLRELVES